MSSLCNESCVVGVWYNLFVLSGKEAEELEGASEDLLAIGLHVIPSFVLYCGIDSACSSINHRTRNGVYNNPKSRIVRFDENRSVFA